MTITDPIDDELLRMAGNPGAAEAVKESLRKLSRSTASPELAEMAKELLAGRTSLWEIGRSSAYTPQLSAAFRDFQEWQSQLSDEERQELEQKAYEQFGDPSDLALDPPSAPR